MAKQLISDLLAEFTTSRKASDIPASTRHRASLLMLDAVGIALASSRGEFAQRALAGLREFGDGDSIVIGLDAKLPIRDAVLLNGTLVHGLDYDDTYLPGSVHLTSSCVPSALALAVKHGVSGEELLTALTIGLEAGARLGAAGRGGFLRTGFHATSIIGVFAATIVAGRLMKLNNEQLRLAQGVALSMASGNMQPVQEGSWTKRMHPGWAAFCGLTAAALGKSEYLAPSEAYEGRFGVFPHFLGEHYDVKDLDLVSDGLGKHWEFERSSFKLYPACHQLHAFMNAAIRLKNEQKVDVAQIDTITALVAEPSIPIIAEPAEKRVRPETGYAAQFSLYYGIACGLVRGRYGLEELEESGYKDEGLLSVAEKVRYEIDPNAGFPKFRSGEVIVKMKNGSVMKQREAIRPDEPAGEDEIVRKFRDNAAQTASPARVKKIEEMVLSLDTLPNAKVLADLLAGNDL